MPQRILVLIVSISISTASAAVGADDFSFFEAKIRPVLVKHCYKCHSASAKKQEGGLLLDTLSGIRKGGASGKSVVPGNVKNSGILAALRHESVEMPPGKKLAADIIADFEKWIRDGASDPRDGVSRPITQIDAEDHWAYQVPVKRDLPKVVDKSWPRDDLDYFVLVKLEAAGIMPVADADRRTLIRRATLELTGLLPTVSEIQEFVNDSSSDVEAFSKVVDRLLASDAFGVRWGRHWLDVARYAESSGYTRNMTYPLAWKYRNWVVEAFNQDLPFDCFVRHQVSGDLLAKAMAPAKHDVREYNDAVIATAFLTLGPKTLNEGNVLQFDLNVADEQIDTTIRAFMGLTVNCARCHDHKYDPISARDYYALAGIFRSTRNLSAVETNVRAEHSKEFPLGFDGWDRVAKYEAYEKKRSEEQAKYSSTIKGREQYRKYWKDKGIDWKKVIDPDLIAAEDYVQEQKNVVVELSKQKVELPDSAMAVADAEKIIDSQLYDKGNRDAPVELVPRGVPQLLSYGAPAIPENASGREQLAAWIVDRRNPLTARVFVNRVWQHLFGIGLVDTPDNFGALGAKPINQPLLDHLAIRFIDEEWSIKRLIRNIVLSRTWMLGTSHDGAAFAMDPGNRLHWRFAPQPLEGEAIRDSILAVSGQLDPTVPKTSQIAELSKAKIKKQSEIGRRDFVVNDLTDDVAYRSIFLPSPRAHLLDVMTVFDAPDPNGVVGQRRLTTLPKQAMFLMNSDFVIESAKRLASEVSSSANPVEQAYERLLARPPSNTEAAASLRFIEASKSRIDGLTQVCLVLICSGEFRTVY